MTAWLVAGGTALASPSPEPTPPSPTAEPPGPTSEPPTAEQQGPPTAGTDDPGVPTVEVSGQDVSLWTIDAVEGIAENRTERTTIPLYVPPEQLLDPEHFLWDSWPMRNMDDGQITTLPGGWEVWVTLASDRTPGDGEAFFTVAKWRYYFTKDGRWIDGGYLFGDDALGARQWAGSVRYDQQTGRASFYYTAVGKTPGEGGAPSPEAGPPSPNPEPPSYPEDFAPGNPAAGRPPVLQQIALTSAQVVVDDEGVTFTDWAPHEVILEPDGEIYQTFQQFDPDAVIYGFRDPWVFTDPDTGDEYLLFVGNATFIQGPHNGVVGVGHRTEDGSWELEEPILAADQVNSQLERPHLVFRDDHVYLYFTTHAFTFAPAYAGPEGLYGFVTDGPDWRAGYRPLNGGGLVAGNPPTAPTQAYSWLVLPSGHVMAYLNNAGDPDSDEYPGGWIGEPAPMFELQMTEDRAWIADALTPLGDEDRPPVPEPTPVPQEPTTPGPGIPILEQALPEVPR
ncbi:glycoside hydrolase family 68 protein [Geodermatophilus sp. SYSU D00758]